MSTTHTITIGTRGSALAMRQTGIVVEMLKAAHPGVRFTVKGIASAGDRQPEEPIENLGIGAFVKELQVALLRGDIDLAVHSLKDLPTVHTPSLTIAAVTQREDPRDALVDRWDVPIARLPAGARIGTGSLRRMAQLRHLRADIQVFSMRGNVTTRMEKTRGDDYDGAVVALAGLRRLGLEWQVAQIFAPDVLLPAPGQGALAIETRAGDEATIALARAIQHEPTAIATAAERAFLALLGGGCRAPYGAYATLSGDRLTLTGMVGQVDGKKLYRASASSPTTDPDAAAHAIYDSLRSQGAGKLIDEMKDL